MLYQSKETIKLLQIYLIAKIVFFTICMKEYKLKY